MGTVTAIMSMSLDGFIAGPNVGLENPMGEGGERLHDWMFSGKTASEARDSQERVFKTTGAFLMGRRMFDLGVDRWGDSPVFHAPVFVLTHRPKDKVIKTDGTTYTFVLDGIEDALEQAKAVAGNKEVVVAGGASIVQQFIKAGWLDEIQLHLIPILLGGGTRLFEHSGNHVELKTIQVTEEPDVTHLRFLIPR